ncbi:sensor histidine kinase [Haloarcula japonica]|uniref:histidine kinase n=1 Tax=Haloarcula japonica (strain ATCC 49778 / DSM 6131 / JCM 7785 / NBRC 101032 / NCIMB 13157 / TR-1) TaxID=1227453 RepID=M0L9K1_HALJT|nr:ATP-binding protein [Haloarcula japonica]EMA30251.1 signal-transducing histidine kinase-like protein [Haloarcula japonica DSM 6131]
MSFEEQQDFARQVADLNKYGQALNRCESVDEVVSLTLEAMSLLFEFSYSTFVEVREDDLRVVHSTNPNLVQGKPPSDLARRAQEAGETLVEQGSDAAVAADSDVTGALAVPARMGDEVTAVLVTRSRSVEEFGDEYVRPMEILATHAATAISNIRSRERLERAHRDLERRKEMIEMYDRLLRHDLGNDLQIIAGFADVVAGQVDGQTEEYAGKIQRAAESAADLIQRVGDLVSTLEAQDNPEPHDLESVLGATVRDVRANYGSLTVDFAPSEFEYQVYGGDLLDSVFTNIMSNAAVHNEGEINMRVHPADVSSDEVTICFADDGDGVSPDLREDIFEMGVKGQESSGTGFGLGFVRALTESYGGSVSVGESDDGGAEFRVTLERV